MRLAFACLVAIGCAGTPRATSEPAPEAREPTPPAALFRWSLVPLECEHDRSSVATCPFVDSMANARVIAAYAPIDDRTSDVAVIAYDRAAGGPLRWERRVDLGADPHGAVVAIVREAVIVAAISHGAVRVAAIDELRGRLLGSVQIVDDGAEAIQIEGASEFARIHVRTRTGGVVAVMHPRTAGVIARGAIDGRAIVEDAPSRVRPESPEATRDDVAVRWEHRRLVVRRGAAWAHTLRIADRVGDESTHRVALDRARDRVIVTVHDTDPLRVEVHVFDHETGAPLWTAPIDNPQRAHAVQVSTGVEDDQIVVSGVGMLERFACTIDLADGTARACVDALDPRAREPVFEFDDDVIVGP